MGLSDAEIDALFEAAQVDTGATGDRRLSDAEIDSLWEKQNAGWNILDSVKQLGTGAIEGIGGIAGLIADYGPGSYVSDPLNLNRSRGGIALADDGSLEWISPNSQKIQAVIDEYLPAKDPEYRYARTIGNFVGPGGAGKLAARGLAGAGAIATEGLPGAYAGISKLLGTTTGNLAAAGGAQMAEDVTGDKALAPMVGAGIFGAVPSIFKNAGTTLRSVLRGATPEEIKGSAALVLNEATDIKPDALEKAIAAAPSDDLGKLMTTAEITGDAGMSQLEKTLAAKDQQAIQYAQRAQARSDARDAIVQGLADQPSVNPERLGTDLINKATEIEEGFASVAQQIWDQVPRHSKVSVAPEQRSIKQILSSRQGGLTPGSKVSTLLSQFLENDKGNRTGILTSGALQDIRSDALMLLREPNLTPFETRLLGALQGGADSAMERSLTGEAYDTWKAARSATAMQKETFGRGTAGGALVGENARPSTVLGTAIKGDKQSIDELARATGGDATLFEGVKRAMLDSIKRDSQDNLTLYQTRKFIGENEGALNALFGEEGVGALRRIADDLKSEAKVNLTANLASKGNSVTAQKQTVAGAIDQLLSESIVPGTGPLSSLANMVRETVGIRDKQSVRELIFKAALSPEFALELAQTPTTTRIFNMLERLKIMGVDAGTAGGTAMVRALGRNEQTTDGKAPPRWSKGQKEGEGSSFLGTRTPTTSIPQQGARIQAIEGQARALGERKTQSQPKTEVPQNLNPGFLSFVPSPETSTNRSEIEAVFNPISYRGDAVEKPQTDQQFDLVLDALKQVESGGNAKAVSKAGAEGAYQIMPAMQKAYGVKDPFNESESREAAKALLLDELDALGSIELALAAYNAGRPAVLRAIKKAGSEDWDEVKKFLPIETQKYIPKVDRELTKLTRA